MWVIKCAELLRPLLKLMHDRILTYDIAYVDETTLQVLKELNKTIKSKKYMWLVCRSSINKLSRITVGLMQEAIEKMVVDPPRSIIRN